MSTIIYNEEDVEGVLRHFGIKGMKWGVRKSREQQDQDKVQKLDKKFEKAAGKADTHVKLWTHSVVTLKKSGDLDRINKKPEYAASKWRLKLGVAKGDLQKKYEDEVAAKLMEHLKKNANEIVNRSATRKFDIDQVYRASGKKGAKVLRESKSSWRIVTTELKQADDTSLLIRIVRDEVGRIIDMIPEEAELAHFGVMGMKWGKRKARPLSTDAKAKETVKTAVKKNKVGSVSNAALMKAVNRMQLEQNYKRLAVNERSGISRWLASTMLEIGKREVQVAAGKAVAGAIAKKVATAGIA